MGNVKVYVTVVVSKDGVVATTVSTPTGSEEVVVPVKGDDGLFKSINVGELVYGSNEKLETLCDEMDYCMHIFESYIEIPDVVWEE